MKFTSFIRRIVLTAVFLTCVIWSAGGELDRQVAKVELKPLEDDPASKERLERVNEELYGARPLKRVIIRRIENPLSRLLLAGGALENDTIRVDSGTDRGDFHFHVTSPEPPEAKK